MSYVYPDRRQVVGVINAKVDDTHLIMTTVTAPNPSVNIEGLCVLCEDGSTLAEVLSTVTYTWSKIGFDIIQTMGAYCVVFYVTKEDVPMKPLHHDDGKLRRWIVSFASGTQHAQYDINGTDGTVVMFKALIRHFDDAGWKPFTYLLERGELVE